MLGMIVPVSGTQTDWASVIVQVEKQVPRIEVLQVGKSDPGICSGVIFSTTYALTAAHCFGDGTTDPFKAGVTVAGDHGVLVRINTIKDIAVVKIDDVTSVMALAPSTPTAGSEIAIVGYAFGSKQLHSQFGRVSNPLDRETDLAVLNVDVAFGESGGAVINTKGQLVGMTAAIRYNGPAHLGLAVPVEQLRSFLKPFLPKTP
jgi:S1-C subfamily serine protease